MPDGNDCVIMLQVFQYTRSRMGTVRENGEPEYKEGCGGKNRRKEHEQYYFNETVAGSRRTLRSSDPSLESQNGEVHLHRT